MNFNKLKDLHKSKLLTQADLADKLGMTRANFSLIMQRQDMKVSQLESIAKILGVSPCYFFDEHTTDLVVSEPKSNYGYNALEVESYKKECTMLKEINTLLRDKITLLQEKIDRFDKKVK